MDLQYEVIMAFHSFNGMASVQSSPGAAAESVATVPTATGHDATSWAGTRQDSTSPPKNESFQIHSKESACKSLNTSQRPLKYIQTPSKTMQPASQPEGPTHDRGSQTSSQPASEPKGSTTAIGPPSQHIPSMGESSTEWTDFPLTLTCLQATFFFFTSIFEQGMRLESS